MKKRLITYNPELKELARQLRNESTFGEVLLWKKLRSKQFWGYDFHRQKPLLDYIVDFYCSELDLVIEIDGSSHNRSVISEKDAIKTERLQKEGLVVVRFTERQVRFEMGLVLRVLENYVREHDSER